MNRTRMIIFGLIGIVVVVAASFPLWSPYFINDVVDEAFPGLTDSERESVRAMPEAERQVLVETSAENPEMAEEVAKAMMADDTETSEDMPAEPVTLLSGTWIEIDPVHKASGTATIYEVEGSRVLRLDDFRVTNGPELHVILAQNIPTSILEGVGDDYVDLGALKGNVGSQNYDIPDDVNLDDFQSVVIYCVPFHVVFSSAALS
jgi:hypothetical protein